MEEKDFIINVGPGGTFRPSGSYHSRPNDVDAIFQKFEAEQVQRITLYFHGGLVNEDRGRETAIKMANHFISINQRPVCFVWKTGLLETVSSNISDIAETKLFRKLIRFLINRLRPKIGFDSIDGHGAHVSLTDAEIDNELCKPKPFENYNQSDLEARGRGSVASANLPEKPEFFEEEFKFEIEADTELISILGESIVTIPNQTNGHTRGLVNKAQLTIGAAKIAYRVIKRFVIKRDHDFYPTIIEEILREFYIADLGATIWSGMKLKSSDMWKDNAGLSGLNQFAGRYFIDNLIEYQKKYPTIQVNLVGHSAGAIAICNLLKMCGSEFPQLIFDNVIFMAPACRIDLFRNEFVKHQDRFKRFRMFTMTDQNEKRDILVPFLYTNSLLYLISGILENEGNDFDAYILGLERHIACNAPYQNVQEIIETNQFLYESDMDRIVLSQTDENAPEGLRTHALAHGKFDDDDATISSIKYMLT